jgi:hypothetical protein
VCLTEEEGRYDAAWMEVCEARYLKDKKCICGYHEFAFVNLETGEVVEQVVVKVDATEDDVKAVRVVHARIVEEYRRGGVTMRCTVCGAKCYGDGTSDCDCDAHDYGRAMGGL